MHIFFILGIFLTTHCSAFVPIKPDGFVDDVSPPNPQHITATAYHPPIQVKDQPILELVRRFWLVLILAVFVYCSTPKGKRQWKKFSGSVLSLIIEILTFFLDMAKRLNDKDAFYDKPPSKSLQKVNPSQLQNQVVSVNIAGGKQTVSTSEKVANKRTRKKRRVSIPKLKPIPVIVPG